MFSAYNALHKIAKKKEKNMKENIFVTFGEKKFSVPLFTIPSPLQMNITCKM